MQNIEITQSQKRIMVIAGIIALVFFIVWLFMFLPEKSSVDKMKAELAGTEAQIQDIELQISKTKTLSQGIRSLEIRRQVLENKFPKDAGEAFNGLFRLAGEFKIKIVSLRSTPKKPFLDENGKEVMVEGKRCEMISLNLVMKGSYEDLIKYRESMEKDLPGFVSLDSFSIVRNALAPEEKLMITWGFNLYFLD